MVSTFRPRIREENITVIDTYIRRQGRQDLDGFAANKSEVRKLSAISLAFGPFDSVEKEINAKMEVVWLSSCEGGEIVPVTAADLQRDCATRSEQEREGGSQISQPHFSASEKFG